MPVYDEVSSIAFWLLVITEMVIALVRLHNFHYDALTRLLHSAFKIMFKIIYKVYINYMKII